MLNYSTTNREGYGKYKNCGSTCADFHYLAQCTNSRNHVKVVTQHIWDGYMKRAEELRYTLGMKELYSHRKTIERIFETAKENLGFRYTQMYGKARIEMKAGLTFACMNLKKLGMMLEIRERRMVIA